MSKPLPIPAYAPDNLTPYLTDQPTSHSLQLLKQICTKLVQSTETFSVTFSELTCPQGKNHLYTLKPYFWELEPGKWGMSCADRSSRGGNADDFLERRDGQRNPYCDRPGGQKQLQSMAVAVHNLALGAQYLPKLKGECLRRLDHLLRVFFIDPETSMIPEVWYAQCIPGSNPLKGDYAFGIAIRYLILVTQSLRLIQHLLNQDIVQRLGHWFAAQVAWMTTSEQGAAARGYGDNKAIWYHAIIASHLAFLSLERGQTYAQGFWKEWMNDRPTPTTFFDRELRRTRPRHYSAFILEPTYIIAELLTITNEAGERSLDSDTATFLSSLNDFAGEVVCSDIEKPLEDDVRYRSRLEWYRKMLRPDDDSEEEPDGKGWEKGWTQRMRMIWGTLPHLLNT